MYVFSIDKSHVAVFVVAAAAVAAAAVAGVPASPLAAAVAAVSDAAPGGVAVVAAFLLLWLVMLVQSLFFEKKMFHFFQTRRPQRPSRQRHPCPHQQDAVNAMVHGSQQVPGMNKTETILYSQYCQPGIGISLRKRTIKLWKMPFFSVGQFFVKNGAFFNGIWGILLFRGVSNVAFQRVFERDMSLLFCFPRSTPWTSTTWRRTRSLGSVRSRSS